MSHSNGNSSHGRSKAPRTSFRFGVASTFPGPLHSHSRESDRLILNNASVPNNAHNFDSGADVIVKAEAAPEVNLADTKGSSSSRSKPLVLAEHGEKAEPMPSSSTSAITVSSGVCSPVKSQDFECLESRQQEVAAVPEPTTLRALLPEAAPAGRRNSSLAVADTGADAIPPQLRSSTELASVLAALDDSQRAAVCFDPNAPLLIQAGAGSGKTQTMASRIAFLLLCGVPPRHILGICFTRQAAETLRQRVRAVLPPSLQQGVELLTLKTLHSFGLQCLRRFGVMAVDTEVYDAAKQRKLARRIVEQHAVHTKGAEAVEALVEYVNKAKMKKDLPAAQFSPNVQDGYLFRFYEAALHEEERAVDFGDLQRLFFDILRPGRDGHRGLGANEGNTETPRPLTPPAAQQQQQQQQQPGELRPSRICETLQHDYTHIVVDEFQDFNEVQFEILAHLAGDACRVTCVGDPNQCIYEWRGAMPNVFQAWKGRFPLTDVRVLQINYRSDGEIVSALNGLVCSYQQPHCHRADRKISLVRCQTDDEVLDAVPFLIEKMLKGRDASMSYSDVAVLCRSRRRVQQFCDALRQKNIPVNELKGVSPDGISIVRALLAYLKLAIKPDLDSEVRIALSSGPRYLPMKQAKKLFFGLAATVAERREHAAVTEGGAEGVRLVSPSASLLCSPAGAPISPFSFYAVLSDAAFHDFSEDAYPKLKGPSKSQLKTIKHFLTVIREAHDRLYRPPNCDVADLIRTVAREGGFESENPVTVDGTAPTVAAAAGRKRRRGRASGSLAEDVVADFNAAGGELWRGTSAREGNGVKSEVEGEDSPEALARRQEALTRHLARLPRPLEAEDGLPAQYTAEEEAAILATSRVSVTELLLCAYEDVMEEIRAEEEGDGRTLDSGCEGSETASVCSARQRQTPAAILRRVLDQFVTLLPSDDYGSLKTLSAASVHDEGRGAAVSGTVSSPQQQQQYPHGHLQTTTVNKVTVSTVHRAKGMEWPSVIIPDCWVGEFPTGRQDREERRVFYVAMSRAMTNLVLVTARTSDDPRYTRKGVSSTTPVSANTSAASPHHEVPQLVAGALVETPYLESMRGREMVEEEFSALRLAVMQAHGVW